MFPNTTQIVFFCRLSWSTITIFLCSQRLFRSYHTCQSVPGNTKESCSTRRIYNQPRTTITTPSIYETSMLSGCSHKIMSCQTRLQSVSLTSNLRPGTEDPSHLAAPRPVNQRNFIGLDLNRVHYNSSRYWSMTTALLFET